MRYYEFTQMERSSYDVIATTRRSLSAVALHTLKRNLISSSLREAHVVYPDEPKIGFRVAGGSRKPPDAPEVHVWTRARDLASAGLEPIQT